MHFRSGPVPGPVQGPVQAAPAESGQHSAASDRQGQAPGADQGDPEAESWSWARAEVILSSL